MKYIIDRFENEFAICEDENKKMIEIKKEDLPLNAKEGDVLNLTDGTFSIDSEETKKIREDNFDLLNKILNK